MKISGTGPFLVVSGTSPFSSGTIKPKQTNKHTNKQKQQIKPKQTYSFNNLDLCDGVLFRTANLKSLFQITLQESVKRMYIHVLTYVLNRKIENVRA